MQVPTEIKTIKAIYDQIIFIMIEKIMTKIRESFYSGLKNVILNYIITLSDLTFFRLSMSAVCTNGQIKAGGIYYMISRALGNL